MDAPPLRERTAIDDFGSCPSCGADLNGPRIWQELHDHYGAEKADLWTPRYGATRSHGRYSRVMAETGTPPGVPTIYRCPECGDDISEAILRLRLG